MLCVLCEEDVHNNILQKEINFAVYRCRDCGPQQFFCLDCAKRLHGTRNISHVLEMFQGGMWIPVFPDHTKLVPKQHKSCYLDSRQVTVIDEQGRQHLKVISFCDCEDDAVTLVRLGLWPGSAVKPTVAFDMKLMDLATQLLLECQVSLLKFWNALASQHSDILPIHVNNVYAVLNTETFDEFRYYRHLLKHPSETPRCPICPMPGESGVLIESMDGCFGLVRRRKAGASNVPPRHGETFFADQADVDNFLKLQSAADRDQDQDCRQFRSGEISDSLRSKGRNEKFDEKAVFGRICRHGYPKRPFFSIKHGERIESLWTLTIHVSWDFIDSDNWNVSTLKVKEFETFIRLCNSTPRIAYAVYGLKTMIEPYEDSENIQIKLMYDIACVLDRHLQASDEFMGLLEKVTLAIPIFHCYVHKPLCQVTHNPRRLDGFGLTDGEGIERLWSYLRGFTYTTREMTPSRRIDVLTDALLYYGQKMIRKLGAHLKMKHRRCKGLIEKGTAEFENSVACLPIKVTENVLSKWKSDELETLNENRNTIKTKPDNWQERYSELLWTNVELRNTLATSEITDEIEKTGVVIQKIKRSTSTKVVISCSLSGTTVKAKVWLRCRS